MGEPRGVIRRSQAITTFGVGAFLDLPAHSAITAGLDGWQRLPEEAIEEPRLAEKLRGLAGGVLPGLFAPPAAPESPWETGRGIPVFRFPNWFLERQPRTPPTASNSRRQSRRLVARPALDDRLRLDRKRVVPTRFVRGCRKGHVDDLDWYAFVHDPSDPCRAQLELVETGATGDLSELVVRCSCGKARTLAEAKEFGSLGYCSGARPWLGKHAGEPCGEKARLLIRTASNAWFPQVVSVLSLPDRGGELDRIVAELWDDLQIVDDPAGLAFIKKKPMVTEKLAPFSDDSVLEAIRARKQNQGFAAERPLKQVELEAILGAPEGFGDDMPVDPNFHARRLPERLWKQGVRGADAKLAAVIQVHRLREVMALVGFTRFDAVMRDLDGEYASDVERASLALAETWFPAVENRGEGVFVQLASDAVREWAVRSAVADRLALLDAGQARWNRGHKNARAFPGGAYVLLHTLAHLLLQSLSLRCGYPAASIRERIYVDPAEHRYGLLLFTASGDAEGTLGGLVEQAPRIGEHLDAALETAALCSNDPVCAHHEPGASLEERWLHGAACHGCTLTAETSCEMHNEYLDRALVAPVIGEADAAFFGP